MGDASYKRWTNTKWWSEGYSRLWENEDIPGPDIGTYPLGSTDEANLEGSSMFATTSTQNYPQTGRDSTLKSTVIYLTADSEDELSELRPDETYIIGGICDHNRYKVNFLFLP